MVGHLAQVPAWEAEVIICIRLWMDGPDGQAQLRSAFAQCFGPEDWRGKWHQMETLFTIISVHARRHFICHGLTCSCIGSDEAVLQTLVREAARGDLAEAAMIAGLLVRASYAEPTALIAAQVGQILQRIAGLAPQTAPPPTAVARTLH